MKDFKDLMHKQTLPVPSNISLNFCRDLGLLGIETRKNRVVASLVMDEVGQFPPVAMQLKNPFATNSETLEQVAESSRSMFVGGITSWSVLSVKKPKLLRF